MTDAPSLGPLITTSEIEHDICVYALLDTAAGRAVLNELDGQRARVAELEAAADQRDQHVANLNQQLADALADVERLTRERDRETELRREAEAHARSLGEALDRKPYPDEYDDMERRAVAAEAKVTELESVRASFLLAQERAVWDRAIASRPEFRGSGMIKDAGYNDGLLAYQRELEAQRDAARATPPGDRVPREEP